MQNFNWIATDKIEKGDGLLPSAAETVMLEDLPCSSAEATVTLDDLPCSSRQATLMDTSVSKQYFYVTELNFKLLYTYTQVNLLISDITRRGSKPMIDFFIRVYKL